MTWDTEPEQPTPLVPIFVVHNDPSFPFGSQPRPPAPPGVMVYWMDQEWFPENAIRGDFWKLPNQEE